METKRPKMDNYGNFSLKEIVDGLARMKTPMNIKPNPKNTTVWFNEFTRYKKDELERKMFEMKHRNWKEFENLKNKRKMKITADTKISELISEGYELGTIIRDGFNRIELNFKKKEVKDFDWYVKEYWKCLLKSGLIDRMNLFATNLMEGNFKLVPFEIKIGLLKFICDDIKFPWPAFFRRPISSDIMDEFILLNKVCPKEFLDSIFS